MRKFGAGYGLYFNKKHKRQGHLFQGRFKAVHIESDGQLKVVLNYIFTNPVSLIAPAWKEGGTRYPKKALHFLKDYKWSSYQDCIGIKNFPSVTERKFVLEVMGGTKGCKKSVREWVSCKKRIFSPFAILE